MEDWGPWVLLERSRLQRDEWLQQALLLTFAVARWPKGYLCSPLYEIFPWGLWVFVYPRVFPCTLIETTDNPKIACDKIHAIDAVGTGEWL